MMPEFNLGLPIGDAGWGAFIYQLAYKAKWAGKNLIKIAKYIPSSKRCSSCGIVNEGLRPMKVREWNCPFCGKHHDTDINAAINIKEIALRTSSQGMAVESMEQPALVGALK